MENVKSEPPSRNLRSSHAGWALVTGLAVGFAIGQTVGQWRVPPGQVTVEKAEPGDPAEPAPVPRGTSPADSAASPAARAYASVSQFPPGWLKETDLPGGVLDGLSESQKVVALEVLNERDCECGCRFGTLASCLKNDPHCPRSPVLAGMITGMAGQGQSLAAILDAVDAGQSSMNRAKRARHSDAGRQSHSSASERLQVEVAAWNPRKGPPAAKVTIIEFSDFQCPFCSRAGPTLAEIQEIFGSDVAIVFKHQPLSFHDMAMGAALAMQAAHRQGRAWEMHDKMFENNTALRRPDLERYAADIGLDATRFRRDMDDASVRQEVLADKRVATAVGATGTPTFFINGRKLTGVPALDTLTEMIHEEIRRADELLEQGTPLSEIYEKLSSAP